MDLQSLFPIYLPKARTDDQSKEDYDTQITLNENVLNQNLNILFNGIRDLADAVDHIEVGGGSTETIVQTVVQPGGGSAEDEPESTTPVTFDMIYPIGSIYMSVNNVGPAVLFGMGTWERIQDRFLLAAGSSYAAGSTGGEATHKLTVDEMPSHAHALTKSTVVWASVSETNGTVSAPQVASGGSGTSGGFYSDRMTNEAYKRVAYTGGGAAHNNLPPYLAVFMWKRTA